MCGRYNILADPEKLVDWFKVEDNLSPATILPTYNAAPSQFLPIIKEDEMVSAYWGLVPFWAKDKKSSFHMINVRSETINEKKSYATPFKHTRCLVPVSGWYEWKKEGSEKQPFVFEIDDIIALAGIYTHNKDLDLLSYSIITTNANEVAADVHDRMPVVLNKDQYDVWLDPEAEEEELLHMLHPYDGDDLTTHKVSKKIGNVRNNSKEVLQFDE